MGFPAVKAVPPAACPRRLVREDIQEEPEQPRATDEYGREPPDYCLSLGREVVVPCCEVNTTICHAGKPENHPHDFALETGQ